MNKFLAEYYCFLSFDFSPSIFFFHAVLFSEIMNAIIWSGEMISSRAFSCWTKHESLSLYFQHDIPFGTLLAKWLASLLKQIIKLMASFLTIIVSVSRPVCEELQLTDDV